MQRANLTPKPNTFSLHQNPGSPEDSGLPALKSLETMRPLHANSN